MPSPDARAAASRDPVPLAVDLDGTLIRTDLLWESCAAALARKPWLLLVLPAWLARGRATLKERLAHEGPVDASRLPYRAEVVDWLRAEHAAGRTLVLATAAHASLAQAVAGHLAIFDRVLATSGNANLKGEAKREALVAAFGERGYDYLGDSRADLPAWRSARTAHAVGEAPPLPAAAGGRVFAKPRAVAGPLARLLRLHQWAKNLLVFVPVVTAHRAADTQALAAAALAFAAFSLAASAVYVVNDLADVAADRRHPAKRLRPFASGEVPIPWAAVLVPLLLAGAAAFAATLPPAFGGVLAAYLVLTTAYTFRLKREAVLDVLALAALYTLRIVAGALAIAVVLSHWLLGFSIFLFLSLAFIKRHVELAELGEREGPETAAAGRGYVAGDLAMVGTLGAASGYLAVLVFALFITGAETTAHYRTPAVLWAAPALLLYWITRAWLLAARRRMDRDPLAFALGDPPSWAVLAGILLTVWAAR